MLCRWLIVALGAFLLVSCASASSINVNLKGSGLSDQWNDGGVDKEETRQTTGFIVNGEGTADDGAVRQSARRRRRRRGHGGAGGGQQPDGILHLDLSGQVHCLISGPEEEEEYDSVEEDGEVPVPLIPTKKQPSLIGTVRYDFSRRWYGATRFVTTLRWKKRRRTAGESNAMESLASSNRRGQKSTFQRAVGMAALLPTRVDLCADVGLLDAGDYAGEIGLCFNNKYAQKTGGLMTVVAPSVRARLESSGTLAVSAVVPVHPRIDCRVIATNRAIDLPRLSRGQQQQQQQHDSPGPPYSGSIQDDNDNEEGMMMTIPWWYPDIRVNAAGQAEARNGGWFRSPAALQPAVDRWGFRLVARRRLSWNALGFANEEREHEPTTVIRLELAAAAGACPRCVTTAQLQTHLEHPFASTRLSVLQEIAVTSSRGGGGN